MALDNAPSQIAHLLRRAGFGATEAELADYVSLGFDAALDRLLNPEQVDDSATDQLLDPLTTDLGDPKEDRSRQVLVAQSHAVHAAAAPGEDDTLLA